MMIACAHATKVKNGKDRLGNQRLKCAMCGKRFTEERAKPLGTMTTDLADAKPALRLLVEGMSIRATERTTGIHRDMLCKPVVLFGSKCRQFLDSKMRGLTLDHLQFDEQWTYVAKKQNKLTMNEREESAEVGDVYLWT